jgi:hypothetical protein
MSEEESQLCESFNLTPVPVSYIHDCIQEGALLDASDYEGDEMAVAADSPAVEPFEVGSVMKGVCYRCVMVGIDAAR